MIITNLPSGGAMQATDNMVMDTPTGTKKISVNNVTFSALPGSSIDRTNMLAALRDDTLLPYRGDMYFDPTVGKAVSTCVAGSFALPNPTAAALLGSTRHRTHVRHGGLLCNPATHVAGLSYPGYTGVMRGVQPYFLGTGTAAGSVGYTSGKALHEFGLTTGYCGPETNIFASSLDRVGTWYTAITAKITAAPLTTRFVRLGFTTCDNSLVGATSGTLQPIALEGSPANTNQWVGKYATSSSAVTTFNSTVAVANANYRKFEFIVQRVTSTTCSIQIFIDGVSILSTSGVYFNGSYSKPMIVWYRASATTYPIMEVAGFTSAVILRTDVS